MTPQTREAAPTASPEAGFVRCTGLTKTYRRGSDLISPLRGLDLEIARGEFVSLMGPSGSGKTTLLNLLAGIDSATEGSLIVDGVNLVGLGRGALAAYRARSVGIVFQSYNLVPVLTARENVELPLLLHDLTRSERKTRSMRALATVGLSDRAEHLPRQLSGGQEQRVAIARAIVAEPALLLADEPTGDLDRESAARILDLLVEINRTRGTTVVLVTHDPQAAARAQRHLRLEKGSLERGSLGNDGFIDEGLDGGAHRHERLGPGDVTR